MTQADGQEEGAEHRNQNYPNESTREQDGHKPQADGTGPTGPGNAATGVNPKSGQPKAGKPKKGDKEKKPPGGVGCFGCQRQPVNPRKRAAELGDYAQRVLTCRVGSAPPKQTGDERVVILNPGDHEEDPHAAYADNFVATAKYNVVTFLPIFLFEVFSRTAYIYFLAQAGLSWWSTISPFSGIGSTAALAFVVVVSGVKAIAEDLKRHREDSLTNTSKARIVHPDGSLEEISWRSVRVGQILLVKDGELFPADLLLLHSALPEKVAYIRTTNLDGETNLKIRRPAPLQGYTMEQPADVTKVHAKLVCEPPSRNLHTFNGRVLLKPPSAGSSGGEEKTIPVDMNHMCLRGCMLKNSNQVVGVVVYAGTESRIQKNAAKSPLKVGSFDRFLNKQIAIIIVLQVIISIASAVGSWGWRENAGKKRYHLALNVYSQGNWENPAVYIILLSLTFWILNGYLVPISLFVTVEIVKYCQAFLFINKDPQLQDPETGERARARNSNLNEDLGQIEYMFSDKTGTLTRNDMRLRMLAVGGIRYGRPDWRMEEVTDVEPGQDMLQHFDSRVAKAVQTMQQNGNWEKLIKQGGSSKDDMPPPPSSRGSNPASAAATGVASKVGGFVRNLLPGAQKQDSNNDRSQSVDTRSQNGSPEDGPGNGYNRDQPNGDGAAGVPPSAPQPPAAAPPPPVAPQAGNEAPPSPRGRPSGSGAPTNTQNGQNGQPAVKVEMADNDNGGQGGGAEHGHTEIGANNMSGGGAPANGGAGSSHGMNGGQEEGSTAARTKSGGTGRPDDVDANGKNMSDEELGRRLVDFWLNVCICHSILIEDVDGTPTFQGPSPDEVALVEGARTLGFVLKNRSDEEIVLDMAGTEVTFQILNVLEFDSDRKRMSVVARSPADNTIRLYCKGADSAMFAILRKDTPGDILDEIKEELHDFANQGLRTLVLGSRVLPESWYKEWDKKYQEAAAVLTDRDKAVSKVAAELEVDLNLVGLSAVEDKLQEGVPEAIQTMLQAGIKVWMITGDKQETAINIAVSCRLVTHADSVLICNAPDEQSARSRIMELLDATEGSQHNSGPPGRSYSRKGSKRAPQPRPSGAAVPSGKDNKQPTGQLSSPPDKGSLAQHFAPGPVAEGTKKDFQWQKGTFADQQNAQQTPPQNGNSSYGAAANQASNANTASQQSKKPNSGGGGGGATDNSSFSKRGQQAPEGVTEFVIDGKTLEHVLGTPLQPRLAELCSRCTSVIVCRASPAQKATIVRMMKKHAVAAAGGEGAADEEEEIAEEAAKAKGEHVGGKWWLCGAGGGKGKRRRKGGIKAWFRTTVTIITCGIIRFKKEPPLMAAIGDGANDVAMLQAADIGLGILGREGRQAVNNSDYALPLFRHVVPLLLVHGSVSYHRLARLVRYSFYKNIAYGAVLFYFQFFCGFSGQALIDDISGSVYNVVFTSLPILILALVDRPISDASYLANPPLYNRSHALSVMTFWKTGVLLGLVHGAAAFFIPYLAATPAGTSPITGLYTVGKTVYVALLGVVTLEVIQQSRLWTAVFIFFCALSYVVVFPFLLLLDPIQLSLDQYQEAFQNVSGQLMTTAYFWLSIVAVYMVTGGSRFIDYACKWLFFPNDAVYLAEAEDKAAREDRAAAKHNASSQDGKPAVLVLPPDLEMAPVTQKVRR